MTGSPRFMVGGAVTDVTVRFAALTLIGTMVTLLAALVCGWELSASATKIRYSGPL